MLSINTTAEERPQPKERPQPLPSSKTLLSLTVDDALVDNRLSLYGHYRRATSAIDDGHTIVPSLLHQNNVCHIFATIVQGLMPSLSSLPGIMIACWTVG
jgi:hypothetical protein